MKKYIALAIIVSGLMTLNATAQVIGSVITNGLYEPYGVAVDTNSNTYYITESASGVVLQYDSNSGALTTFAGGMDLAPGYPEGFVNPQGLVAVPARNGLVLADSGNHAIWRVGFDRSVSVLAGGNLGSADGVGTAAEFNAPAGLAADTNGTIYVADMLNNAVRRLDMNGRVTTVATGFYKPAAVAIDDANDRLFVADTGNHSIMVLNGVSTMTNGTAVLFAGSGSSFLWGSRNATVATNALFNGPRGLLWVGGATGLLVCDTGNAQIRQIFATNSTQFAVRTYAKSDSANLIAPISLARDVDGNYLFTDLGHGHFGDGTLRNIQVTTPLGPVPAPVIGIVTFVKDSFGEPLTFLVPVESGTYNNDVVVAIRAESGTETFFTKGTSADIPGPADIGAANIFSAPPYSDGLHQMPTSIVIPNQDGPDVVIKSYSRQVGRKPSPTVLATFKFKVANPVINGRDPGSLTLDCSTSGAKIWYTVYQASDTSSIAVPPGPNNPQAILYDPEGPAINLYQLVHTTNDVVMSVVATKTGYENSSMLQQNYAFSQLQIGLIGVPRDFVAGVGATILVPIQVKLPSTNGLRSLQFRVEITPNASVPPILDQFRQLNIDPSADFIKITIPSPSAGTATNYWVSYSLTNNGAVTRGLEMFWLGTNANFSVQDFGTIALLRIPIPPTAKHGDKYTVSILNPSGTSDGQQSAVRLQAFTDRLINVSTNVGYLVGDSAVAQWYNAGDFGNGNLNNNDVNNAFYASLGIHPPFPFSDVFDAMDAFPLDSPGHVGGDGQIRFLDWQIVLQRSLRLPDDSLKPGTTNNWYRRWDASGRRVVATTNLNSLPDMPAEKLTVLASGAPAIPQAIIGALPVDNIKPGDTVTVPVYVKVAPQFNVKGLQFRAIIVSERGAPTLTQPAQFLAEAGLPGPIAKQGLQDDVPINQAIGAWSLQNPFLPALTGEAMLGYLRFTVPANAQSGQRYTIHFANADGAPDMSTQYTFETLSATVWIGTAAQTAPETVTDEWKARYFGNYSNPMAAGFADPDQDKFTNAQEYRMGTVPTIPDWRFKLDQGSFELRWFAEPGCQYVVESSTDLNKWSAVKTFPASDALQGFSAPQGSVSRFYRVRTVPSAGSATQ